MAKYDQVMVIVPGLEDRTVIRRVLESSGYKVHERPDLATGLAFAEKQVPHLLLVAMTLPDGTALDLLERRRRSEALARIPVLLLGTWRDKAAVHQALSLGASDHLVKPLDAKVLLQKTHKALRDREYLSYAFPEADRPTVTLRARATIVMGNEAGFLLEAPFKIAPETRVRLESALLDSLELDTCVLQRTEAPARPGHPGQYLNDVAAVGLSPKAVAAIKRAMRKWT